MTKELFADYVKEKKLTEPEEKKGVAQTLITIYVEARKKEGSSYSMRSLKTLRLGLNRYFKSTRGIEIINDVEFNEAKNVFTAQCIQLKKDGQAKVQHKPPILDDDLKKTVRKRRFQFRTPQDASERSVLRNHAVFLQTWSSKPTTIEKSRLRSPQ